jgi:peptide/nickel transport system substrate-binding protein
VQIALFGIINPMKRFRWQFLIIFLTGIVIGVLLLIGEPGKTSPIISAPSAGGTYVEALIGSLQRLNPVLDYYNSVDRDIDRLIFSSLIKFDSRGFPVADLAENWGVSHDGTIYNINLRAGAKWHDGTAITTEDVAFTVDLLKNGGTVVPSDLQKFWSDVTVNVLSPTAMQFILPEPFAPFIDYLNFGILPKHILDGIKIDALVDQPFNLQPVGSGPYRFDSLIIEDGKIAGVVLKAYDGYYLQRPFINEIDFRYYPDGSSAFNAYKEGKVQGINKVSTDILTDVMNDHTLSLYAGRDPQLCIILFNLKDSTAPYLQDVIVRKALYTALDRQGMINTLMDGQGIVADGTIFPGTWAYYENVTKVNYDPDAAKNMLIEDGYALPGESGSVRTKNGTSIIFTLLYPDDAVHQQLAQYIQKNWESLDIRVEIKAVPYDQLLTEYLDKRTFQAALVDLNFARTPDPDPYPFWDQSEATGGQNYTQWDNRLVSEYLENARITNDVDTRAKLYRNFQVVFTQELPALPLFYPVSTYAVSQQIQGISFGPLFDTSDRFSTVTQWYLIANASSPLVETPTAVK